MEDREMFEKNKEEIERLETAKRLLSDEILKKETMGIDSKVEKARFEVINKDLADMINKNKELLTKIQENQRKQDNEIRRKKALEYTEEAITYYNSIKKGLEHKKTTIPRFKHDLVYESLVIRTSKQNMK